MNQNRNRNGIEFAVFIINVILFFFKSTNKRAAWKVFICVETASTERYARNWFGEYLQPISRTQQPISKHVRNLFHFASRLIILISIKMLNSHRAKLYGMTRSHWHSHLVWVCVCLEWMDSKIVRNCRKRALFLFF